MRKLIILCCMFGYMLPAFSQQGKVAEAVRVDEAPRIDGKLDDACWDKAMVLDDFSQFEPYFNKAVSQRTAVRIVYDDRAVYIGAMMYDTAPDSILHQLGSRDDDLNADKFTVAFDTYNNQADAFVFRVFASGVQTDYRYSDGTYNGVWQSATKIGDSGWVAEIMIPYSALRFPDQEVQEWGFQTTREIRRHREHIQWALVEKGVTNDIVYWGKLKGISAIKPPLRLSVTPYLALFGDHYPFNNRGRSNFSGGYSGGLDLKWGINESYTVDMTLLPDFSQVQSDNLVKNISAFETYYDEYRPFFNEGIELFEKGDLFYSRRIGRIPRGYYAVNDSLKEGEVLVKNPGQARLLNATKLSGRGKNGTALGLFNAVTDNAYALIEDSNGQRRKVLTEPLTNFNIFVYDQVLKNNSDIYLINTNVTRVKSYDDANVTAGGLKLNDKSNTWQFNAQAGLSQLFHRNSADPEDQYENTMGYRYYLAFSKIKGHIRFEVMREHLSKKFNINDFGLMYQNNETRHFASLAYKTFEPKGLLLSSSTTLSLGHHVNAETQKLTAFEIGLNNVVTFKNYLWLWSGATLAPLHSFDYYEPRQSGRYYRAEPYYFVFVGFSSDYRHAFALDGEATWISTIDHPFRRYEVSLTPLVRASDKLFFTYTIEGNQNTNDEGFAGFDTSGQILFGNRKLAEIENSLDARYIFINDLSLGLRLRHYWSMGAYKYLYTLTDDGRLIRNDHAGDPGVYNFNYNALNIDLLFSWQFAPGSNLSVVYKLAILGEQSDVLYSYWDNIRHTFASDQLNSLSIKALYYLDYQYLKKRNRKRS